MHPTPARSSPWSSGAPAAFRLAVIALAVIVLCSCRSSTPAYRVAATPDDNVAVSQTFDAMSGKATARFQDPGASDVQIASYDEPAEVATDQVVPEPPVNAECPPDRGDPGMACSPDAPCGIDGCASCAPGAIRGPSDEYLCDGGDMGAEAAVVKGGNVAGLDPEDAVAHYDTVDGRTIITPSNKVCIYAPRFAAVRQVVDPLAYAQIAAAEGAIRDQAPMRINDAEHAVADLAHVEPTIHRVNEPPSLLRNRQQAGGLERQRRVAVTLGSVAAYANLQSIRTGEVVGRDIVKLARASLAAITWTGDQAAQVLIDNRKAQALVSEQTPGTIYLLVEPNNPKLRLIKLASTDAAQPGDEVEFTLRFDNVGDRVIGNVTILDSLTTRLEYVEDSQKSSVDAEFTSRDNEGSSLKLRWQIHEPLKPGEGGVIQFRCRVR